MPRHHPPLRRERGAAAETEFRRAYNSSLHCLQKNRFTEAIEYLDAALKSKPGDVSALTNLGSALSAVGDFDEALAAYDEAVAGKPDGAEIHYNRANILRALAREADAICAYDRAIALKSSFPEAFANRGHALEAIGRDEEALTSYDAALALHPRLVEALFGKVHLLERIGRLLDALAAADEALEVPIKSGQEYLMRGRLLERLGRTEQALADFTSATRVDPKNATAHASRGDQLAALGRSDEALKAFERAIQLDPGFAEAHDRAGLALVDIGRIDEARAAHEKAVALSPDRPGFYYNLTAVAELGADDPKFLAMTRKSRDIGALAEEDQIPLRFALAKACTDQGNYRAAFEHLRAGNALKRARIKYDEHASLSDLETVREIFTAQTLARHRGHGDPATAPLFVLGMPRSGSTLIEQILASHPKVHGAGEITDFADAAVVVAGENLRDLNPDDEDFEAFRARLRRIGSGYISRIRARDARAERVVNKMPDNFRLAGLIHLALPNARIIHARRDPVDTCLSCYSKLFSANLAYAYDLRELGRYYRAYDALMAHWRAVLPGHVMLEVGYEELVADPATHAKRMVEHCGLDWNPNCLDFHRATRPVRTASAVQVRKPIYSDAVARAKKFGADLAPLIGALDPSAPESAAVRNRGGGWLDRLRKVGGHFRRLCASPTAETQIDRVAD